MVDEALNSDRDVVDYLYDMTVADIRDLVREFQDEIPELADVHVSQNKDPLVQDTAQAILTYENRTTSVDADETMETPPQEDPVQDEPETDETVEDEDEDEDPKLGQAPAPPISFDLL